MTNQPSIFVSVMIIAGIAIAIAATGAFFIWRDYMKAKNNFNKTKKS